MTHMRCLGVVAASLLLAGCITSEWVHPNKPSGDFTQDWNKCEMDVMKDPKLQQGMQMLVQEATERCVKKKGWVLREVN